MFRSFCVAAVLLTAGCGGDASQTGGPDGRVRPDTGPPPGHDGALPPGDGAPADAPAADGAGPPSDSAPPPAKYSFVVYGDNQFATASCTSGTAERLAVPEAIADLAPTFIVHTGDLMDHGYEAGAYAKYVDCNKAMLTKIPLFSTMGNHDAAGGATPSYKAFLEKQLQQRNKSVYGAAYETDFTVHYEDDPTKYSTDPSAPSHTPDLPSGFSYKTFYAYRFRNAYFLSFEIGTRWWSNTPKSWVEKHLQAARADPSVEHVFVHMHHPMYSTTMAETADGECIQPVRKLYQPLFRKYDVTMVFSGHAHLYDRFYVPDDGAPTRQDPPPASYAHDGKAVHYIVTGGGGGGLNGCKPARQEVSYEFFQRRACVFHVTRVQVEGRKLSVSVVQIEGSATSHTTSVIDSFVLQ